MAGSAHRNSDHQGWLVLTRGKDESIIIDNDIEIKVVSIDDSGRKIRIGISAPKDKQIWRKELWLEIQEQNKKSVQVAPDDLAHLTSAPKSQKSL